MINWVEDTPPCSLNDSNANLKMKTMEQKRIGVCSLVRNISRVKWHVGTLGWGLGQMTSELIIHTDLHKPNKKLVSAWVGHFWCTNEPWAYTKS